MALINERDIHCVSFHNGNIDPGIIEYQKKVFEYFGQTINQVETSLPHGQAIDAYLNGFFKGNEKIAIFDIDCIPVFSGWWNTAYILSAYGAIYGAAQQANHIPGSGIYVSPAFICFDGMTYETMGKPSFEADEFGDVGSKVTRYALAESRRIEMLWPIHVEQPMWDLGENSTFGLGTTYQWDGEPEIYHAFQSRMGNGERFINKCKEVLDGKYK